jgi:hypothetical protein
MTSAEAWEVARRRLVDELGCEVPATVSFVADATVDYALPDRISVRESDLFGLDDDDRWQPFLSPRPTWLHFNLLTIDRERKIVAIRRSGASLAADDRRATPVNVSAEHAPAHIEGGGLE